ncbi:hypothetical protein M0R45_011725 [Rubus argutus]|uniref:Uncharacterized protein n=1 Tax=Rubus argutus TaxID=59490 RepID=A0AAW1YC33_RUBAR
MEDLEASLKARIEEAENLIATMGQDKLRITETLEQKMFDQRCLLSRLVCLNSDKEGLIHSVINEKKKMDALQLFLRKLGFTDRLIHSVINEQKKMDALQLFLRKLGFTDNAYQKKPIQSYLSAQEMSKHNLHFRMVHGSKSLAKEKQVLKEFKVKEEKDCFASFWSQWEEDLVFLSENVRLKIDFTALKTGTSIYRRYQNGTVHIDLHTLKQTWWLQHQMPFLISKGDTKDREGEIRELEWRIERCGVVLQKKADKTPISNNRTANANPTIVKGKAWTTFSSKKALQEQVKLAGKKIEQSRKTQLTLGLGPKIGQAERELVALEKDIGSLMKQLPGIDKRKDYYEP